MRNWAGNYEYRAARIEHPGSVDELQDIVARSSKVRALGTRHSFNDIADTTGTLVLLDRLDQIDEPDPRARTVSLQPGVTYGQLCSHLNARGWALHNLASLPHISVVGACATATHGSGNRLGNLATAVRAFEIVTDDGELATISRDRDGDRFDGMVVSLGALGIVTKLTLAIEPAYAMRQDLYQNLILATLEAHFDEITSAGDSVSLFTNWQSDRIDQVWLKRRVRADTKIDAPDAWFGAARAIRPLHPIPGISPIHCTQQLGIPGPWHERLPHFRMDYTPSSGEELQSEYFVARSDAIAAIRAVFALRDSLAPLVQISEIRTIAADELWMSPCYRRESVAIHFTWRKDQSAVERILPLLESALAPFSPRPHWGKLFCISPAELSAHYPRIAVFVALRDSLDPARKFVNRFIERVTPNSKSAGDRGA